MGDGTAAFKHAPSWIQNNVTIVMAAVQNHGSALEHAPEEIKNNEAIVITAKRQTGLVMFTVTLS
jgi:hypothetical protein